MAKPKITDVTSKIVELLEPIESEGRHRIIQAALLLLGEGSVDSRRNQKEEETGDGTPLHDLPGQTRPWMKQNSITSDDLHEMFHFSNGATEIIGTIQGKTDKEQTQNAYILLGVKEYLTSGDPSFSDKDARAMCVSAGCFNSGNHTSYLKAMGNWIAGSKEKGWKLTAPGLKHAASLIKAVVPPKT